MILKLKAGGYLSINPTQSDSETFQIDLDGHSREWLTFDELEQVHGAMGIMLANVKARRRRSQ